MVQHLQVHIVNLPVTCPQLTGMIRHCHCEDTCGCHGQQQFLSRNKQHHVLLVKIIQELSVHSRFHMGMKQWWLCPHSLSHIHLDVALTCWDCESQTASSPQVKCYSCFFACTCVPPQSQRARRLQGAVILACRSVQHSIPCMNLPFTRVCPNKVVWWFGS